MSNIFNCKTKKIKSDYHLISPLGLLYHHWNKSQENRENNHQLKKILIVNKQILLISTLGDVERTVWRIYMLMLES